MTATHAPVLHLVDSLGLGGAQTILKEYFEARTADAGVHLYALRTAPREVPVAHPNVRVHPSSSRFSLGPLRALERIVGENGIRVLHCHLFRAQAFGYLLKRFHFPDIKLVFHEHGRAVGREGESGLEALTFRWFLRLAWRQVDRFICISELTRSRLLQLVPEAGPATVVVANPIPVYPIEGERADREAIRRENAVPDDAFVVGFASRLVERKGWSDFLEAMAVAARELPVHFLLAGDGEDRARAEARIHELGIAGRGRMLGHIDWMRRFYQALDCFVMPSHWEPHGLAHLEAQSFGIPVVVARVPGLGATVHDDVDALLFEAGNVGALTQGIRRIATDAGLRARLAEGGRANAAHYSLEAFAESLDAIYASLGAAA